jgi:hypothetical protein
MNERITLNVRGIRCPFAMVGGASVHSAAFYCRLPSGRVREPDRDERRRFCLSGCHRWCPFVQRYACDE